MMTMLSIAADTRPAGGAELAQVVGASVAASLLVAALLVLGLGHRSGRVPHLGRWAARASRLSGLPGWAALPAGLATVSLLSAAFGLYWDISLHIDDGRDAGPLANPSHYFILLGLYGILSAGWLALVLPEGRPGPAAVRIGRDWYAPVSGVMLMACAAFALVGFPLDDISHRLFGQDVTLWGPTHLMMLGGAAMTLVGILALFTEGRLAAGRPRGPLGSTLVRRIRAVSACGGLLIGLSIFQGEFDFGVPQFRLLFHPVLLALAASLALVTARVLAGRGAAIGAAAFFIVVRGGLAVVVGPVLGETTPHLPLYLAEALLVEAVALRVSPSAGQDRFGASEGGRAEARRAGGPYRFGIAAGALVGSLGVLAEWGWSHAWMPIPWPAHVLPEAIALALPVAIAGGVLGAFVGGALRLRADVAATRRGWAAAGASLLAVAAVLAYLVPTTSPDGARAVVTLEETRPAPNRAAQATVRFDPPAVTRDHDWLTAIAWQGRDKLIVEPLQRIGDGVYRTSSPVPVHGTWKTAIRLHRGRDLATVPIYLPADPGIPAAEVPAPPRFERALVADHEVLQRERKPGVAGWLWAAAGAVVLGCAVVLLALMGWSLARLAGSGVDRPAAEAGERRRTTVPA
jgi:hypothetical protein